MLISHHKSLYLLLPTTYFFVYLPLTCDLPEAKYISLIVAVAAGQKPNLTLNPFEQAATITAFIVQASLGDLPHGTLEYKTIFAAGLTLVLMTLVLNIIGHFLAKKYREIY